MLSDGLGRMPKNWGGVDPNKIISDGGSAGGHLFAATGTIKMLDEEKEDQNLSSKPNAIVLLTLE